jgi:hypothetical protein
MKNYIYIIVTYIICSINFAAHVNAGAFDNTGLNASPLGMAEAYTAIDGGMDSVNYNPAGTARSNVAELTLSYRDFYNLGLIDQKYFGVLVPGKDFNIGFSWHRIGTTGDVDFLDYKEDMYILTVSRKSKRLKDLCAGANFKFFRVFSDVSASGYGCDVGIQYRCLDNKLNLGLLNKNIGDVKISWDTDAIDVLDSYYQAGAAYNLTEWVMMAMDYNSLGKLNLGTEISVIKNVFILRGGIKDANDADKTLTTGLSINYNNIRFDYALSKHYDLEYTHFFTLNYRIKRGKL